MTTHQHNDMRTSRSFEPYSLARTLRYRLTAGPPADGAPRLSLGQRRVITLAVVVCTGYLTLGRPFAYIGIPQINLFLAESLLIASVFWGETRRAWTDYWTWLLHGGRAHLLCWALVLNLVFGVFEFARGVARGNNVLEGLKELTLNYSPFFLIIGLLLGRWSPNLMHRIMLSLAWANATYGVLQVFVLSHLNTTFPGQPGVVLFDLTSSAGVAIIWLAMNSQRVRYVWILLPLNGLVLLGHQVRGEWTGFAMGLVIWLVLSRQIRRLGVALLAVVGLLGLLWLSGISLPSSATRGGNISVAGIVGRAISPFAPDEAAHLVGADTAGAAAGTAAWRTKWWHAIGQSANSDPSLASLGHGYGYQLSKLTTGVTPDIRTPHDIFYYLLGYTGYIGVAVLVLVWVAIAHLLWRGYKTTGEYFGLIFFAAYITMSLTSPWFETPIGATPTYLFLGICIGPSLAAAHRSRPGRRDYPARSQR